PGSWCAAAAASRAGSASCRRTPPCWAGAPRCMRSAAAATWCVRSRAARSRGSAPRPGGAWCPWGRRPGAADVRIGIGAQVGILGGPGTYARALAGALAAAGGHEYVVFTDRPEAFAGLGVETVHVPLASPYHQAAWDHWRLPGLVAERRLDLYHGTKNVLPWRLAMPAVVTVHDLAVYAAPEPFAWAQRWHLRLLLPRAVAAAARAAPAARARRALRGGRDRGERLGVRGLRADRVRGDGERLRGGRGREQRPPRGGRRRGRAGRALGAGAPRGRARAPRRRARDARRARGRRAGPRGAFHVGGDGAA